MTIFDGPVGTSTPAALASASGAISAAFTSAATVSAALTSSALGSSVLVSAATGSSALTSAGLASSAFASVAGAAGVDSGLAASAGLSSVLGASAAGVVSAGFCSALLSFFLKIALSLALRLSRAPGADVVRECDVHRSVAKPTNARHDGGCLLGDGMRVPRNCQPANRTKGDNGGAKCKESSPESEVMMGWNRIRTSNVVSQKRRVGESEVDDGRWKVPGAVEGRTQAALRLTSA